MHGHVHTKIIDTCTATDSDIFHSIASCLFSHMGKENRLLERRERGGGGGGGREGETTNPAGLLVVGSSCYVESERGQSMLLNHQSKIAAIGK